MSSKSAYQKLLASFAVSILLSSTCYINDALASSSEDEDAVETKATPKKPVPSTQTKGRTSLIRRQSLATPSSPSRKGGTGSKTTIWQDSSQVALTSEEIGHNIANRPYAFTMAEFAGTFIQALTDNGVSADDAKLEKGSIKKFKPTVLVLKDTIEDEQITPGLDATLGVFYAQVIKGNSKALDTVLSKFEAHEIDDPIAIDEVENNPFNITATIKEGDGDKKTVTFLDQSRPETTSKSGFVPLPCNRIYYGFHGRSDEILYSYSINKIKALKAEIEEERRINDAASHLLNEKYPHSNLADLDHFHDHLKDHLEHNGSNSKNTFSVTLERLVELKAARSKVQQDQFINDESHPQYFFEAASKALNYFRSAPKDTSVTIDDFTFGLEDNKLVVIGTEGQKIKASERYKKFEDDHHRQGVTLIQGYNEEITQLKMNTDFNRFLKVLKLIKSSTGEDQLLKAALMQTDTKPTKHILAAMRKEVTSRQ